MTNEKIDYIFHLVIFTWKNFLFMGKPSPMATSCCTKELFTVI